MGKTPKTKRLKGVVEKSRECVENVDNVDYLFKVQ